MNNVVEEIKRKIDIIEFVGSFITLKKTGRNFKGICPFHQEKTPSFVVSPERQIWHCFGACQDGGDAIKFLMKWENITFSEAIREFGKKLGIKIVDDIVKDKLWQKKEHLITINTLAKEFYEYILNKSNYGAKGLDYLEARKINKKIIEKFELGYAPHSWDSLYKFLLKKKYSPVEMLETGLLVKSEKGSVYDRFRGRLVFPIKDIRGNTIGFSGRALDEKDKSAKYINTPETVLYHKRESLFGIQLAKEAIKKEDNVILVEGEFDMISPYQNGVENIVAIKGSAVTKEQLQLLKRYTNRINLALDADNSGEAAIKRGIEEAEFFDFDIGIINIDFGKDPDEAVRNNPIKFKEAVKKPIPIYDFIISFFIKKYPDDDPFSKKKIADGVVPFISNIKNPVVESYAIKKFSRALGVDENSIESLIRSHRKQKKNAVFFKKTKETDHEASREMVLQKYILSLIFQSSKSYNMADKVFNIIDPEYFTIPAYEKICLQYMDYKNKNPNDFIINQFVLSLEQELKPVFDEIYLFASIDTGLEVCHYEKIAYEIKKYYLKNKIKTLFTLSENLTKEKEEEISILNKKLKELENLLSKL